MIRIYSVGILLCCLSACGPDIAPRLCNIDGRCQTNTPEDVYTPPEEPTPDDVTPEEPTPIVFDNDAGVPDAGTPDGGHAHDCADPRHHKHHKKGHGHGK